MKSRKVLLAAMSFFALALTIVLFQPTVTYAAAYPITAAAEPREAPFLYTQSSIQLPNRRLTDAELQAWIDEYNANGGPSAFELEVIRLTNVFRAEHGREPVLADTNLMKAARFYAQTLANLNLPLGHNLGPYGGSAETVRLFGGGGTWRNGHWGVWTPEAVVNGWINSPGHRANLLQPAVRYIGVGSHLGGQWGVFHYMALSITPAGGAILPPPVWNCGCQNNPCQWTTFVDGLMVYAHIWCYRPHPTRESVVVGWQWWYFVTQHLIGNFGDTWDEAVENWRAWNALQ